MTIGGIPNQPPLVEVVLATFLVGVLLVDRTTAKGTTLTAPLNWATLSALLLLIASFYLGEDSLIQNKLLQAAIWYIVGCSTFCPLMAVLGAKRPQNLGWQWVVATLWLILVWPALQALALPAGPRLELFAAWRLFLLALIVLGLLNYLPTRHWLAALFTAAGQGLLLGEYLEHELSSPWRFSIALGSLLVASVLVMLRRTKVPEDRSINQLTQRWLSFRNAYGAFWGLRIMQRVNETGELRHWPVHLTWFGFEPKTDRESRELTQDELAEIEQTLDSLLRRFF